METMLSKYRKFYVALAGLGANAITQGLVTGTTAKWLALVLGALTAAGVVVTPNAGASE